MTSLKGGSAIQSVLAAFESSSTDDEPWTPRRLGMQMALGGLHPCPIGSASQVADVFEEWINEADVDGFNVAYITNPGGLNDVVELLVPELQRRGVYWDDYAAPQGTFRENLYRSPGGKGLRVDHYGAGFKWDAEKANKNGNMAKRKFVEDNESVQRDHKILEKKEVEATA